MSKLCLKFLYSLIYTLKYVKIKSSLNFIQTFHFISKTCTKSLSLYNKYIRNTSRLLLLLNNILIFKTKLPSSSFLLSKYMRGDYQVHELVFSSFVSLYNKLYLLSESPYHAISLFYKIKKSKKILK